MAGKNLEFVRETFFPVADFYSQLYQISQKDDKENPSQNLWEKDFTAMVADSVLQNLADLVLASDSSMILW